MLEIRLVGYSNRKKVSMEGANFVLVLNEYEVVSLKSGMPVTTN